MSGGGEVMATHKIIIAGFGGQGVMLIGQMIAKAAMLERKEVTWMPAYGPEMRGGTANCTVVVSDKRISSPIVSKATAVVAMNLPSLRKFENMVESDGDLFINTSLIKEGSVRKDVIIHSVNANQIAAELKNDKVSNMVILGAIVSVTKVVTMESVEKALEQIFSGKKQNLLDANKHAIRAFGAAN
jgi:2-oxoglutarate ferredoxin oxidoreductase subunit gamma